MRFTLQAVVWTKHSGFVLALLMSCSIALNKIQVWDLRMGGIFETIQFDHAVTALQFDTRKIIAATGENGVKVGEPHHIF